MYDVLKESIRGVFNDLEVKVTTKYGSDNEDFLLDQLATRIFLDLQTSNNVNISTTKKTGGRSSSSSSRSTKNIAETPAPSEGKNKRNSATTPETATINE